MSVFKKKPDVQISAPPKPEFAEIIYVQHGNAYSIHPHYVTTTPPEGRSQMYLRIGPSQVWEDKRVPKEPTP
jgi:hypothetical protein